MYDIDYNIYFISSHQGFKPLEKNTDYDLSNRDIELLTINNMIHYGNTKRLFSESYLNKMKNDSNNLPIDIFIKKYFSENYLSKTKPYTHLVFSKYGKIKNSNKIRKLNFLDAFYLAYELKQKESIKNKKNVNHHSTKRTLIECVSMQYGLKNKNANLNNLKEQLIYLKNYDGRMIYPKLRRNKELNRIPDKMIKRVNKSWKNQTKNRYQWEKNINFDKDN